jgi:hypothetical protein
VSVIEFPGNPPPDGYSEEHVDKVHGEAFRELEMNLRDCVRMGGIATQLMSDAKVDEHLMFAVFHLGQMLMRLEKEYDVRWNGERQWS